MKEVITKSSIEGAANTLDTNSTETLNQTALVLDYLKKNGSATTNELRDTRGMMSHINVAKYFLIRGGE